MARGISMKTFLNSAAIAFAAIVMSAGYSHAEDLTFTLKNKTKGTLERFYTSPTGVGDWEEDVFGKDTLGPGRGDTTSLQRRNNAISVQFLFLQNHII